MVGQGGVLEFYALPWTGLLYQRATECSWFVLDTKVV